MATTNDTTPYQFFYTDAPWYELNTSVDIFLNLQLAVGDPIPPLPVFAQGTNGTDTLTITVNTSGSPTPGNVYSYPYQANIPGTNALTGNPSTSVNISAIDQTGNTLAGPVNVVYAVNTESLLNPPVYNINYTAAPYTNVTSVAGPKDSARVIINMPIHTTDTVISSPLFLPSGGTDPDNLLVFVLSNALPGDPTKAYWNNFGPAASPTESFSPISANGVLVTVVVMNGTNVTAIPNPKGKKSYGFPARHN